mgnify:CR=1 FL=1
MLCSTLEAMRTKALVPVMAWFVAVIVLAVTAQPRWFVIHAFTLGAVTTSIVYWSQYWTDKFMRQRSDAFRRCVALNAFILLMFVAVSYTHPTLPTILLV